MGDIEVGVEAKLGETPPRAHRPFEQLLAQQPICRVKRLRGPEQLLLLVLPFAVHRGTGVLDELQRRGRRAAVARARVCEHDPLAGAAQPHVQLLTQDRPASGLVISRQLLSQQRIGDPLGRRRADPGVHPN